ncbi:dienelactone hydrolase family protein (plasmid) [Sphingopyxis indica]|uniref:dienelactone hydrolase family protein n=1 Tax=Sphingopyxis indica TaxID=436663 RepID=UPI00293908B9|nr:dienelactone hydrolase family protein [Sphingopyxis indica]WOF45885.1 dienelactone hydrolase family protein [Sphingopyxis indica]
MCHTEKSGFFALTADGEPFHDDGISGFRFGEVVSDRRVAILPDIYGCTPFYKGFAAHLAALGAKVDLIDIFDGLGDLPEQTRERAFERRHRLKDRAFLDRFEAYARRAKVNGVVGFCIGGLFVYELARRDLPAALVSFYGFPQGLPNQDALDTPLTYLGDVTRPHLSLFGEQDELVPVPVQQQLRAVAERQPACRMTMFAGSGHAFLADLDSAEPRRRDNAIEALRLCEEALFATAPTPA